MIRFALFGAGRAGTIHAQNIANHQSANLAYLFDVNQTAAERLVASFGGERVGCPEDIWVADDVDAVLIASPTDTHVDLLRGAIRGGKATYCEKPIDLDIEKVKSVVLDAERTDLPIFIGFRRRFVSDFQSMRHSIQSGAVGRIETIHVIARDYMPPSREYVEASGGFLRDKMIHYFDLIPWLADERPTEVYATGSCLIDPTIGQAGDIDTAMVVLRMPSGALCHIENSRRAVYGYDERIEVFGSNGMLQSKPPQPNQVLHFTERGIVQDKYPDSYGQESFAVALDAFITSIASNRPISPSLQDGLQAQLIAEAAVESLQTNKPVTIQYDL
ncbi:Gfo/Idh/MocA family oxidoreductase [Chloroflexi bacterium TSY]|nr:Gfo/Idh/MocA family oxidoreductase [Chloroflexi bacterium TSY]